MRADKRLVALGARILDWTWERGWDTEYGGLCRHRDVDGLPMSDGDHDMKLWWPQVEAVIATLLAYHLTGEDRYARWHEAVHDWAHGVFRDPRHGEWFGYLYRDGSVATELKGDL